MGAAASMAWAVVAGAAVIGLKSATKLSGPKSVDQSQRAKVSGPKSVDNRQRPRLTALSAPPACGYGFGGAHCAAGSRMTGGNVTDLSSSPSTSCCARAALGVEKSPIATMSE